MEATGHTAMSHSQERTTFHSLCVLWKRNTFNAFAHGKKMQIQIFFFSEQFNCFQWHIFYIDLMWFTSRIWTFQKKILKSKVLFTTLSNINRGVPSCNCDWSYHCSSEEPLSETVKSCEILWQELSPSSGAIWKVMHRLVSYSSHYATLSLQWQPFSKEGTSWVRANLEQCSQNILFYDYGNKETSNWKMRLLFHHN